MKNTGIVIAGTGMVGMAVLSILATHYTSVNPKIAPLVDMRQLCADTVGIPQRMVDLTWAPVPAPGEAGNGLRVVFRPIHGPNARTRAQQADELARFILRMWGRPEGLPALAFVEIRAITGDADWTRVEPYDYLPGKPGAVAPPKGGGYPPPAPAPAPTPPPGG